MDKQIENKNEHSHPVPDSPYKFHYLFTGTLVCLSLLFMFISCSFNHSIQDHYTIGQDPRWKEIHLNGKERNLTAFNTELLTEIANVKDFQVSFISTLDLIKDLKLGKIQGALTTLEPNYSNEDLIFSDPYFLFGPILIEAPQYNRDKKKENGKNIIGISPNSPLLGKLQEDPSIQIKFFDDILSALGDLKNGRIDGAIFPAIPAYTYTDTFYKGEFKIKTAPLTDQGVRLAALKNSAGESLIKRFNEGLKTLKENGTYHDSLTSWSFADVEVPLPQRQ